MQADGNMSQKEVRENAEEDCDNELSIQAAHRVAAFNKIVFGDGFTDRIRERGLRRQW